MPSAASCPSCGAALASSERHGRSLLRCDGCGGSWIDDRDLELVAAGVWRAGAERRRFRGHCLCGRWAT